MGDTATPVDSPLQHIPATLDEVEAMSLGVRLGKLGPAGGANPQVGCVILARTPEEEALPLTQASVQIRPAGDAPSPYGPSAHPAAATRSLRRRRRAVLGYGWHQGAGTPHAEVDALSRATALDNDVRGATAVVTLEPCNSTGRTGPCTQALISAGIRRVVYAVADPMAHAAGSNEALRSAGVQVEGPWSDSAREAAEMVHRWLESVRLGRPYITLKIASSLDGRTAAADGTSKWITGTAAREHAHRERARLGAILIGSNTALIDDPALTARLPDGALAPHQPVRVVMGNREIPSHAKLRGEGGEFIQLRTHDVNDILNVLLERGIRHLLVEGGSTVAAAFVSAGVVDELQAYIAPVILGGGPPAIADCGIRTLTQAPRWATHRVERLGDDTLMVARRGSNAEDHTTTSKESI